MPDCLSYHTYPGPALSPKARQCIINPPHQNGGYVLHNLEKKGSIGGNETIYHRFREFKQSLGLCPSIAFSISLLGQYIDPTGSDIHGHTMLGILKKACNEFAKSSVSFSVCLGDVVDSTSVLKIKRSQHQPQLFGQNGTPHDYAAAELAVVRKTCAARDAWYNLFVMFFLSHFLSKVRCSISGDVVSPGSGALAFLCWQQRCETSQVDSFLSQILSLHLRLHHLPVYFFFSWCLRLLVLIPRRFPWRSRSSIARKFFPLPCAQPHDTYGDPVLYYSFLGPVPGLYYFCVSYNIAMHACGIPLIAPHHRLPFHHA